jgi:hypothetical protein
MQKKIWALMVPALMVASSVFATEGDIDSTISTALTGGATKATTYLGLAMAVTVAFFAFKLGKRAINKA